MPHSTADQVLACLQAYNLIEEQPGEWRCNSPLRPNADSHSFYVKIDGPEHGTWFDHVSNESGSLYDLATCLGIALPANQANSTSKRGYQNLADYAQAHGVPASAYTRWGWQETIRDGRQALSFPTASGTRYRFLDGAKPTFTSPAGYQPCWYGLAEAVALAQATGQALVLCNGEPSVVAAQYWGVAACCVTGSGEKLLKPNLLQELQHAWSGPILIALDCDTKGRAAAPKLATQVHGIDFDLGGSDGFDLADYCRLHQGQSVQALQQLAQAVPMNTVTTAHSGSPLTPLPTTVSARILAALQHLNYRFRLNLLTNVIEANGESMTDVMRSQIRTALRDMGVGPIGAIDDVIVTEAARDSYHPITSYFDTLAWDGMPRIQQLAHYLTSHDAPIIYADGSTQPLIAVYLRRWLIGAIAKVYVQAQNMMLVLVGSQRSGKSTLARWLCPLPRLFIEGAINVQDKDNFVRLMSAWMWEVAELDATTRKADVSALKDFITKQDVTVRKAYDRYDVTKPATASLIGTVNESDGFLADSTGNRRFLVVTIDAIDFAYMQLDIHQLWAEALHAYQQGEPWELTPEEYAAQTETNRQHETSDILEGWIDKYFWIDPSDATSVTTADIIDHLRTKEVPVNADRQWETRIGTILRRRGLTKQRQQTGLIRAYRWYGLIPK